MVQSELETSKYKGIDMSIAIDMSVFNRADVDFNSLKKETKLKIFSHLELGERLKVARVSRLFRDLAYDPVSIETEYRENIDRTDANGSIEKIQNILREAKSLGITVPKITYENIKELKDEAETIKKDSIIKIWGKIESQLPGSTYPNFSELKKKKYDEVIQEFDNWIEINKDNITSLDLNNLGLSYLPESLGNLNNLTRLNLKGNQLSTIPDTLGNLSNLENLTLSHNQLSTIPDTLGNLSNLEDFNFDNNQLSTIPDTIGNLSSLKGLYLRGNQLSTLPKSIQNLKDKENPCRIICDPMPSRDSSCSIV